VFVGRGRGGLSAEQRADVMGLAQSWQHEATGAISADLPVDTPNARAAADAFHEIRSLLMAAGVPPRALLVRRYHPTDPQQMATIRLNEAVALGCVKPFHGSHAHGIVPSQMYKRRNPLIAGW
jgi:pilus assembly protein CpaD